MRLVLLIVIGLLAVALVWLNAVAIRSATRSGHATGDAAWREARTWDFANGEPRGGWGWGERRCRDGYLELSADPGETAVYIVPVDHAPDFVLTAEVMIAPDAEDRPADAGDPGAATCVHLMTRDAGGMNHLSGVVVCAGGRALSVYHKVNGHDHLQDIVPTAVTIVPGSWHRLRFTAERGAVAVHIDGEPVFASTGPYPPGLYGELYVAAENGRVRIRRIQVLEAPPIGAAAPGGRDDSPGGGHER